MLVVKLRHHGDVLLTTPVLSTLKRHFPHLEVDALVYAETQSMLAGHPALDHLFVVDRAWRGLFRKLWMEWRLFRQIRRRRHDLLICLTEQWRCAWLARLLPARHAVVGEYPRRRSRLWRRSFSHHYAVPVPRDKIESHLDSLRRIGCPVASGDKRTSLPAAPEAARRIAGLLAEHGLQSKGFVLVHPTSRWIYKCWMPERYAEVINQLSSGNVRVVLTAAPSEPERSFTEEIMKHLKSRVVDLTGKLTLPELGELIREAGCFLGVDSVPMHMAAAAGTPLVALFGPSNQAIWAPKGAGATVLASASRECLPCMKHGCGNSGYSECLEDVTVERVLAEIMARFHSRQ
ncbi:MAG TPA: putative lipopolysaccharide heptosyltransferase III [Burkholderiales bacterium]